MKIDLRDVRTRWINVDKDVEKANQMIQLFEQHGFTNHERFSAVTGIEPHEGVRKGEEHYRNCAESHFKILEDTILSDGKPVLILEDDVDVTVRIEDVLQGCDIPDDAAAVYFGTSHGDGNYVAKRHSNEWLKISGVFATHAIMYLNEEYATKTIEVRKSWIYERNIPFDVGLAYELQKNYSVYAPITPVFYQSDAKNTANKWEQITITPLRIEQQFRLGTMA